MTRYGSWRSPVTADLIVSETVGLGQLVLDGDDTYWMESRPLEGGRNVIVRSRAGGGVEDMLPSPFNARTSANEYGGGAYTVSDGVLYFSNFADQCMYRLVPGEAPRPITPPGAQCYADVVVDIKRRRLICVREDHTSPGEPRNSLVAINLDGRSGPRVLVSGADFYSTPRLSPDAGRLAWLSWNHPDMPWDGTELWLAELGIDGSLIAPRKIAGGRGESLFQPEFSPDGELYFVSDRSNWWNLYRLQHGRILPVVELEAEFGAPQWVFGMSTYGFPTKHTLVCSYNQNGIWRLGVIDVANGRFLTLDSPYTDISSVAATAGRTVFIGAGSTRASAVVQLDPVSSRVQVLRSSTGVCLEPGYLSRPRAIQFPSAAGDAAYGFYYPPRNHDYEDEPAEKPPLLVVTHGGPTAATSSSLNLKIQFWTSRGFAVLDVNYRGSSGYGREYRRKLDGQWGIADVEDCVHGARYLVQQGLVDGARLAVRGGSAGGYTTLCALTFHRDFKAGASYYGVSDLEALARDTHKFESRYLECLVGPYPARRDIYRARSPIHHVERLSCPMIFFQGLEDKVVPPDQTERMVQALRAKRLPVAYVAFENESHGFRRAQNIKRALEAELYFYGRIFGFEPADRLEPVTIENL